jgi:hypothetical protein
MKNFEIQGSKQTCERPRLAKGGEVCEKRDLLRILLKFERSGDVKANVKISMVKMSRID